MKKTLIFCMLLFICVSCGIQQKEVTETNTGYTLTPTSSLSSQLIQEGILTTNPEVCISAPDKEAQRKCKEMVAQSLALQNMDPMYCDMITEGVREDCQRDVAIEQARIQENHDACLLLTGEERIQSCIDETYMFKAKKNLDKSLCTQIISEAQKKECLEEFFILERECDAFSSSLQRSECTLKQSQKKLIESHIADAKNMDCSTVLDTEMRLWCDQEMKMMDAILAKKSSLCEELSPKFTFEKMRERNYKKECLEKVSK